MNEEKNVAVLRRKAHNNKIREHNRELAEEYERLNDFNQRIGQQITVLSYSLKDELSTHRNLIKKSENLEIDLERKKKAVKMSVIPLVRKKGIYQCSHNFLLLYKRYKQLIGGHQPEEIDSNGLTKSLSTVIEDVQSIKVENSCYSNIVTKLRTILQSNNPIPEKEEMIRQMILQMDEQILLLSREISDEKQLLLGQKENDDYQEKLLPSDESSGELFDYADDEDDTVIPIKTVEIDENMQQVNPTQIKEINTVHIKLRCEIDRDFVSTSFLPSFEDINVQCQIEDDIVDCKKIGEIESFSFQNQIQKQEIDVTAKEDDFSFDALEAKKEWVKHQKAILLEKSNALDLLIREKEKHSTIITPQKQIVSLSKANQSSYSLNAIETESCIVQTDIEGSFYDKAAESMKSRTLLYNDYLNFQKELTQHHVSRDNVLNQISIEQANQIKIEKAKNQLSVKMQYDKQSIPKENRFNEKQKALEDSFANKKKELEKMKNQLVLVESKTKALINERDSILAEKEKRNRDLNPKATQLQKEQKVYSKRVNELQQELQEIVRSIQNDNDKLKMLKQSNQAKQADSLLFEKFALERKINKWSILINDRSESIKSLESFSRLNSKKRKALLSTLSASYQERIMNDRAMHELEEYSRMLDSIIIHARQ